MKDPLLVNTTAFLRALRRLGFATDPGAVQTVLEGLAALPALDARAWHDVLKAVTVKSREQDLLFERAFEQWVLLLLRRDEGPMAGQTLWAQVLRRHEEALSRRVVWMPGEGAADGNAAALTVRGGASGQERLARARWVPFNALELRQLEEARRKLAPHLRPGHRRRPQRRGAEWDLRRSLRQGAAAGEMLTLYRRGRVPRRRPLLLLLDVSGSMEPYIRLGLTGAYALVQAGVGAEVFACGTRLTRLTPRLAAGRPDRALARSLEAVPDLAGGTRLADALEELARRWAGQVLKAATDVVLMTDGLESGDPAVLERRLAWIKRRAGRLWWWNPLAGGPGYRPLARGAAVLAQKAAGMETVDSWPAFLRAWDRLGRADASSGAGRRGAGWN